MVPLQIKGFFLDQDRMPVAVLCDEVGQRALPVWIGPSEASAIIVRLGNIKTPGPLTHDLLAATFLRHGFRMDRLELYARSEAHGYAARIRYRRRLRRFTMEVRPSDGLAMAVRLQAPICACEELLAGADATRAMLSLSDPGRGLVFLHAPRCGAGWQPHPTIPAN